MSGPLRRLTPSQQDAVARLAAAAEAVDGTVPLNEEARLALARDDVLHWLLTDAAGDLVAYGQWNPRHRTGQLCVDPAHRRGGLGTQLLGAVAQTAWPRIWAFGDIPAARAFADASGMGPARGLHIMARPLGGLPTPRPAPPGVTLRPFTWVDADALLAVNAAAFKNHPEQGQLARADLQARVAEPWFDAEGLILAEDADGLLGFHWTKRHDDELGEVYVLAVAPRATGRGIGGVLLDAGLAHLRDRGHTRVILYVDADNVPAVTLYERAGFEVVHSDVLYAR